VIQLCTPKMPQPHKEQSMDSEDKSIGF